MSLFEDNETLHVPDEAQVADADSDSDDNLGTFGNLIGQLAARKEKELLTQDEFMKKQLGYFDIMAQHHEKSRLVQERIAKALETLVDAIAFSPGGSGFVSAKDHYDHMTVQEKLKDYEETRELMDEILSKESLDKETGKPVRKRKDRVTLFGTSGDNSPVVLVSKKRKVDTGP
jgi:hypothetical protein